METGAHGADGAAQLLGGLGVAETFYIAEHDDLSIVRRQFEDGCAKDGQIFIETLVCGLLCAGGRAGGRLLQISADLIACHADQIWLKGAALVGVALEPSEQRQEDVLSDLFGGFALTRHVECETKDRSLMPSIKDHEGLFIAVCGKLQKAGVTQLVFWC
jgi:hypothetical protein